MSLCLRGGIEFVELLLLLNVFNTFQKSVLVILGSLSLLASLSVCCDLAVRVDCSTWFLKCLYVFQSDWVLVCFALSYARLRLRISVLMLLCIHGGCDFLIVTNLFGMVSLQKDISCDVKLAAYISMSL